MHEILNKLNKYELRIRKAVNTQTHGTFKSIFRGAGLEFADLRSYQYGDDIRTIDWNTTAKGHDTYVKIYKEDREQQVVFMVDVSASQEIGQLNQQKIDIAKEIAAVLALSATKDGSQVGLYCFTDQKELYIKPEKRPSADYRVVSELLKLKPLSTGTNISGAISFMLNLIKRKSMVVLISDFIDEGYANHLKALARKHDLVTIHIYDDREINLPKMGIVPVYDKETQRKHWINTSSSFFRKLMKSHFENNRTVVSKICKENDASYIDIECKEDYVPRLIQLFRKR